MVKLPCEVALWYVLPQIRADLSREMVSRDISQKRVAELLGVTQSAVSQYLHRKRGSKKRMPKGYRDMISKATDKLLTSEDDAAIIELICDCCVKSRSLAD